jgi:isopropylmalate/homocitrate/citramalate synthase
LIDRAQVWTGELNELALGGRPAPARVGLYDTTLRDGEQTVGVVLDPGQKLRIAQALDALGIERIEAGFPRVSADDVEAFRLILDAGLDAEVWGFSRAVPADVEALLELGVRAAVIESPVSDGKLTAYGISREKLLERVRTAVSAATEQGMTVCFFGVDGSRADLGFLERVYREAVEAGARELAVVDTLGAATPEAAALLVGRACAPG